MARHDETEPPGVQATGRSRRARLHGLLFAGSTFGTTLVMLVGTLDPKRPLLLGE